MNDITIFNHLGNDIRVITNEQGEPWFVLKDICDALEIGNTSRVADRLDSDDLTLSKVIDNRGVQRETAEGDLTPSAFGKIRPQLLVTPAGQSYFAGILGV